jgi:magnesium transporter
VVSSLPVSAPELCQIVHSDGTGEVRFTREDLEELVNRGRFFWLELERPDTSQLATLRDVFEFHPLAIEDAEEFDQRPKIDGYEGFAFLVVYGASPDEDRLVEVHCFYSERLIITIHRDECPALSLLRDRYGKRPPAAERPLLLLYRIVNGLVDSFFPALAEMDDRIDELQDAIFSRPDERQLQEVFEMKRLLVGLRKVVTPQRDTLASLLTAEVAILPALDADDERYFRDVYDHLIRINDLIDSYRDLLTGAMDVYLSTVSNRLNNVGEGAHAHRHCLSSAHLADRVLRAELRLAGGPHRRLASVRTLRALRRARDPRCHARLLLASTSGVTRARLARVCAQRPCRARLARINGTLPRGADERGHSDASNLTTI